jgi:hypothetical protein
MLGIAARRSTASLIGCFKKFGQTSVTKMAIPKAIGTPRIRAREATIIVPVKGTAPPNFSKTGSHSEDKIKLTNPNF